MNLLDDPLSSAAVRYTLRSPAAGVHTSAPETRPFALRHAQTVPTPARPASVYDHEQQIAVDAHGRPLIETMGKEWKTKASSDGDEGPEEDWGWEEG